MIKKKKKNLNKFVYGNFKEGLRFIKESKRYIYFSFLLFFFFGLIGFLFPIFFKEQILEMIKELISKTYGLSVFELVGFIFKNNLTSSFFAIFLGIFFGLFPIFILILNGYLLGFVSYSVVSQDSIFVLWRLLPHGIFEIPAIMISAGLGLKLGLSLFYKIIGKKINFIEILINSFKVFVFIIIPLLFIAGIIEGVLIYFIS